MRPILFLMGVLLMIYLVYSLFAGLLQYSMYGVLGTGIYDILNYAAPNSIGKGAFLSIVYILVFLAALVMIIAGLKGERRK